MPGMRKIVLVSLLVRCCLCLAQSVPAVPVDKEPHHHLALQNATMRAFEVEVPPRTSTLLHYHGPDYVYVTLGKAEIVNAVAGKGPVEAKLEDGHVAFAKGNFAHVATNKLDTPFRNVTIEILKPGKSGGKDTQRALEIGMGGLADPVLDNDEVRVYDVQLSAGGMLHEAPYPHPMLLVAVSNLDVHQSGKHGSKMLKEKVGGLEWLPAGTYGFMNMTKEPQRFVLVEFK